MENPRVCIYMSMNNIQYFKFGMEIRIGTYIFITSPFKLLTY